MSDASNPPPLLDRPARDIVTGELDRNLFVEAGAGSGKTTSLVRRIVNLVDSGVPVGRIAAITFTEAAARELRVRVRDELDRQGTERADRHLANAAGQVESAAFTTLHGFALRVLSDHPVEAGLPPGFAVADEIGSMLEFEEAWREFAGQLGDDLDLLDLQERAAALGVEFRRFVDIARRFDDNWDLLGHVDREPAPLADLDLRPMLESIVSLRSLNDHCLDGSDRLAEGLSRLADQAEEVLDLDPIAQLEWLDGPKWPARNVGRKANWVRLDLDEARGQIAEVRTGIEEDINQSRVEIINHYVARVATFVEERVARRQTTGELAFHDLLVLARQLLRTDTRVREQLHQRYSRILLDEFQDTDPIQIELAVLIAADGEVGERPWQELAVDLVPGRLAVVGDPKQSIYRFRRADTQVYADAEAALDGDPVQLTTNFRSVPGVVAWVNDCFERLIGDGESGAQPRYTPLSAMREADPAVEVPVLCIGGVHEKSIPVGEIRQLEAADVAAVICRAIEEEWLVERDGQWLPLRLQDVAVLIPSRLSLPALEAAFSAANLPFRPETSSLVYATQEVREVLAGVRAIVDPGNSVDVVAALRSGLFAVGDDDLLAWHLAGGTWNYASADVPQELVDGPVAAAFEVLAGWYGDRWWLDPSALIDRIVRERRLREAALAEPRPRDRWRRYRFLAEQAREFTATRGGDLYDFAAWVEVQSSDLARVTEPIPAEPDDDAVRVLTIHGSKGLEFPMVVLAGAPTKDVNRASGPQVLFPPGASPEVKLAKGKATQQFDVHMSIEEVLDRYERVRLQYVAATRARDLLVVSAHHKVGLESSGRRIWDAIQDAPELWRRFERRGDERYRIEPPTQLRLAAGSHQDNESIWLDEQRRLLERSAAGLTYSATGVATEMTAGVVIDLVAAPAEPASTDAEQPVGEEPDPEREPWRTGRAGSAVGSAVHAVLQVIDFDQEDQDGPPRAGDPGRDDIAQLARLHAEREGVAELADEVRLLVESALTAPSIDEARRNLHWRELYVSAPIGDSLVEGFVDLCIDGPDGLIVVDYKTDPVANDGEADAKLESYRYQGGVYALALEHITSRPVAECRFVFVGPSGVIERTLPDLDGVKAAIVDHLESRKGKTAPTGVG